MSPINEFNRLIDEEKVTVHVGAEERSRSYNIPRSLLRKIEGFNCALRDDTFQEGATGKINLPEHRPDVFEVFHYYLYHEDLAFEKLRFSKKPETDLVNELDLCLHAWIFGDKYRFACLQNAVTMRACDILTHHVDIEDVPEISLATLGTCYGSSTSASPLRKLAADYIIDHVNRPSSGKTIAEYEALAVHNGFLGDIFGAQKVCSGQPHSFPRYFQPIKHGLMFHVQLEGGTRDSVATESRAGFVDWDATPSLLCEDCMFVLADSVCESCEEKSKRWPCKHNFSRRKCVDCMGLLR